MPISSRTTSVVHLQNVSKHYHLRAGQDSLRSVIAGWARASLPRNGPAIERNQVRALQNVTFDVHEGQALGIIGSNGAGKTTILKLLSGITPPTSGSFKVRGRLSALIELGAGFHPDLTGRENVFLNGVILGLTRRQIKRRYDDIVAFAEIENFMEMPVKRYSSGMYARLGFAVAAHVDPDILLIDEVLAVGDTSFQYKCLRKIRALVDSGRTVIFISHNLDAVQALCPRVIWLDHGQIRLDGPSQEVIGAYLNHQERLSITTQQGLSTLPESPLSITKVMLKNSSGEATNEFNSSEDIVVEFRYETDGPVQSPAFSVGISDQGAGLLFLATMLLDEKSRRNLHGAGRVTVRFSRPPLMPKAYQVWGSVRDAQGLADLVSWQPLGAFRVITPPDDYVNQDSHISMSHLKNDAPIHIPHVWDIT